jgi:hypothetical protein
MKEEHHIENLLRSLQPAPLAPGLRARLAELEHPSPERRRPAWLAPTIALVGLAACLGLLALAISPRPVAEQQVPQPLALTVHHSETTLIRSEVIDRLEHGGRLWDLVELTWQDEQFALSSASPIAANLTETRQETILRPVAFY